MTNIVSGTTPVALVQNGTVISTVVSDYVNRYRTFAKQTAQSILGLAVTLVEAKKQLSSDDFTTFCNEISLKKDGSTYKKIMKIGNVAPRFDEVVELLPNSWTTIYDLAKLNTIEFTELKNANVLSPTMTAFELKKALNKKPEFIKENKKNFDFIINVENLDIEDKNNVYNHIYELKERYKFSLETNERLYNEVVRYNAQLAA